MSRDRQRAVRSSSRIGGGNSAPLRSRLVGIAIALLLVGTLTAPGCSSKPKLQQPVTLSSPYPAGQVWAVAPFLNESGVSIVDGSRVADLFVEQLEQVNGIDTVPVNRVLLAMRRLELRSITTAAQARSLMKSLGVDGLVVGTVTAYDPYSPPKLGAAVQLFLADQSAAQAWLDPVQITRARTESVAPGAMSNPNEPVAQAAGVFDASNHQVLSWLDEFAMGRTEPDSAYGRRIYLVSMELYTQFVAYRLVHDLLWQGPSPLSADAGASADLTSASAAAQAIPDRR